MLGAEVIGEKYDHDVEAFCKRHGISEDREFDGEEEVFEFVLRKYGFLWADDVSELTGPFTIKKAED
jgi:hypothetical protein